MGALAALTGILGTANQAGEAGNEVRAEKQARADKLRTLDVNDAYLQLAKQAEARQVEAQKQSIAQGDLLKVGNRLWSVSKGKFVDTNTPNPLDTFNKFVSTLRPEDQGGVRSRFQTAIEADPGDVKGAISEGMRYADTRQTEFERREDAKQREEERRQDKLTSDQTREREHKENRAEMEAFIRSMVPYRLQEGQDFKGKELTPAAAKIVETTTPTLSQVDRLLGDIDRLGLAHNNKPGYLAGARLKYALGMASPEGTLADDIAGLSLGSVIEAGSAMQGTSRSVIALQKALVHTPNAWKDSPMLMHRKLTEIRQRLQDMVNDAQKYGTKGATPGAGGAAAGAGGSLDPAVQQYLNSIGVTDANHP